MAFLLSAERCTGVLASSMLWRQVKDKTPPKSSFKGRAVNYAYTDAKKIRKHLLSTCDYALSREDNLEFLVAVKCFGYQGGVVSVWVYFALLDKSNKED